MNHAIFQADEIFGEDTVAKRLNSYLEKKSLQCDNVAGCIRAHTLHDALAAFLVFVAHDFHILVLLRGQWRPASRYDSAHRRGFGNS